jgi:hypothetical protein
MALRCLDRVFDTHRDKWNQVESNGSLLASAGGHMV